MKLIFSQYIDDIFLHNNSYNVLHFQNILHENYCLNALREYVKIDKDIDVLDFNIEKSNGKKLSEKDILYLPWNYSTFEKDVNVQKILMKKLTENLESQEQLFLEFQKLNGQLLTIFSELSKTIEFENYRINFDVEKLTMTTLLKSVKTSFVSEKMRFLLSIFEEKSAYLNFMLQHASFQLVIVEMPESVMNLEEKRHFFQQLQKISEQITILVITNDIEFVPLQETGENLNFINEFGNKRELDKILREGHMFTNNPETLNLRVLQKLLQEHHTDKFIPESILLEKIIHNKF